MLLTEQGLWALAEYRFSHWGLIRVRLPVVRQLMLFVSLIWHKLVEVATGICLPAGATIGKGLYIGHFGGIFLSGHAVLGEHCTLSQCVTVGYGGRGEGLGEPVVGDRVYIAAGAKVIGKIQVGNDVAIGANAVVVKDVPDHAVVVGVPARVVNMNGSADFLDPPA